MSTETVVKKLRNTLKSMNVLSDLSRVTDDENLFGVGALDSLTLVQYVLLLEEEYNIRINNADIGYEQFQSFSKIASLLCKKYKVIS